MLKKALDIIVIFYNHFIALVSSISAEVQGGWITVSGGGTMASEEGQVINSKLGTSVVKRSTVAKWLKRLSKYRDFFPPNFFKEKT